jgi:repressor of nif and glnA expression
MIGLDNNKVERKVIAILKVLSDSQEPLGSRVIAYRLRDFGIELGERAVRYHLKLLDERGLTSSVGMAGQLPREASKRLRLH